MRNKLLLASLLSGLVIGGYALTFSMPIADAGGAKNLKIYPKGTDKAAIKKDMKLMSKALDVDCDFCHDMDAMDKDSDMKNKARDMMKMTAAVNKSLKTSGFKQKVTCMTCHGGKKKPKN